MALVLGLAARPVFSGPPQVYKAARIWTGYNPAIFIGIVIVRDCKVATFGARD